MVSLALVVVMVLLLLALLIFEGVSMILTVGKAAAP